MKVCGSVLELLEFSKEVIVFNLRIDNEESGSWKFCYILVVLRVILVFILEIYYFVEFSLRVSVEGACGVGVGRWSLF